jgi:hypothetical protein
MLHFCDYEFHVMHLCDHEFHVMHLSVMMNVDEYCICAMMHLAYVHIGVSR